MVTRKEVSKLLVLTIVLALSVDLFAAGDESGYRSKGPLLVSSLKGQLQSKLPIYIRGIWPELAAFEKCIDGTNLESKYVDKTKSWLSTILKTDALPGNLESTKWHGLPKLHSGASHILGQFYNSKQDILTQFQADGVGLSLTCTSEKYFTVDIASITDDMIIQMMSEVLNFPEGKVSDIAIEKHVQQMSVGEDKVPVCYGKLRCNGYDEKSAATPSGDNMRTWWNFIPFWIVDGTVSINTTTVKWEQYPATLNGIFFEFGSK